MHNEFKTAFIRGPGDFTHNREGEVLNHYRQGLWTVGESRLSLNIF